VSLNITFGDLSPIAQAHVAIQASRIPDDEKLALKMQLQDRTTEAANRVLTSISN